MQKPWQNIMWLFDLCPQWTWRGKGQAWMLGRLSVRGTSLWVCPPWRLLMRGPTSAPSASVTSTHSRSFSSTSFVSLFPMWVPISYAYTFKILFFIFTEPPHVSLSEEKLILKTPQTLKCYSSKYYPLDAQVSTNLLWQIIDFDNI